MVETVLTVGESSVGWSRFFFAMVQNKSDASAYSRNNTKVTWDDGEAAGLYREMEARQLPCPQQI
jgi:hypothetical protein